MIVVHSQNFGKRL